ncbi:hypothetical protein [Saccharicrinis sp. 156]|uniref:hypothetical protein n=1 Tax=Saccharicrinis sp. 156 TaxID=3417574 RepID=UPI003D33DF18
MKRAFKEYFLRNSNYKRVPSNTLKSIIYNEMKTLPLTLITLVAAFTLNAQPYIALHSQGHINYYETFQETLDNAVDNDTVYIPGGLFEIGEVTIDKSLHIYGVGYHPDSVAATAASRLDGNLRIVSGADKGSLSGIRLHGWLTFGTNAENQTVNNLIISRCYFFKRNSNSVVSLSYNGEVKNTSQSLIIEECVFDVNLNGGYCPSVVIRKNIFHSNVYRFEDSYFSNSIFLGNFSSMTGCVFENNYICQSGLSGISSSIFNHNIFRYTQDFPSSGNINNGNNIMEQRVVDTFVNVSGISNIFNRDYHLKDTSPGKGAGSDGTDIGIYGTSYPFKHVPENPHISYRVIKSTLNENGTLDVEVHVRAQDR